MLSLYSYQRLNRALFHRCPLLFKNVSSQHCKICPRLIHGALQKSIKQLLQGVDADNTKFVFDKQRRVIVYTDGCCHFNNSLDLNKRKSGIGVYWGASDHPLNISMPIRDENVSSNRAELLAAHAAVQVAIELNLPELRLRVDSIYVKKGCEKWLKQWQSNSWMTTKGTPVKNQDLWKPLANDLVKIKIKFQKVNDGKSKGQKMAHDLANSAARIEQF